jgi:hypothetical protein
VSGFGKRRRQKFLLKKLSGFGAVCAPTCERGLQGAATDTNEEIMGTSRNTLALRRQSIRTLTADELRVARGGQVNGTVTSAPPTTGTSVKTGTCIPTRTTVTIRPTQTKQP